jgi:hypothetical protein
MFTVDELSRTSLSDGFGFSKGAKLMKVPVTARAPFNSNYGPGALLESDSRLYDLENDPRQKAPVDDPAVRERLTGLMLELMAANEAPPEAYVRLGLKQPQAGGSR